MAKKLTDKEKVMRVNRLVAEAIDAIEQGKSDRFTTATTKLYQSFAILQSDKDDEFMITNLWIQLQHGGKPERQMVLSEQKNKNPTTKSGG